MCTSTVVHYKCSASFQYNKCFHRNIPPRIQKEGKKKEIEKENKQTKIASSTLVNGLTSKEYVRKSYSNIIPN